MNINPDSQFYKFLKRWVGKNNCMPYNRCDLVKTTILCFIKFAGICMAGAYTLLGTVLLILWHVYNIDIHLLLDGFSQVTQFIIVISVLMPIFIVGGGAVCLAAVTFMAIAYGIFQMIDRIKDRRDANPKIKEKGFIATTISDWKDRTCTMVTYNRKN